jgi:exopolyphosphatase/guanosine-5'-triphosphate,3'-diphosphate pyrophosphatase
VTSSFSTRLRGAARSVHPSFARPWEDETAEGRTLAAIDIGTNSIHLVVARVASGGRFEVVTTEKEMVRLGSSGTDMKRLAPKAVDRGIEALTRFRLMAEAAGAPVRAVATSAVREAENRDTFIQRARDEARVEVEVISGFEEARLIHLGVLQAVPVIDLHALVVDIGGGSTELVVGYHGEALAAASLKLGAIRLTRRFFPRERIKGSERTACQDFIRAALVPFFRDAREHRIDLVVASSGTAQAVAAMASAARGEEPPTTFNLHEVTTEEVGEVVDRLLAAKSLSARKRMEGLDPSRADILPAGALILHEVLVEAGAGSMVISGYALREGVLLDTLQRLQGGSLHHLHDLRRRSVLHLADLCDDDQAHSERVAELALELFDGTEPLHGLDLQCREYLEAAALLANVGLFVSHAQHHKHTYYVIRNSEHLAGFTDREIELIALVARYHRKSAPKLKHPEFARLPADDREIVRALAGILRVAIALDRTHAGVVAGLRVQLELGEHEDEHGRVRLVVVPEVLGADLSLELYTTDERKGLLEEVLGVAVVVEPEAATASAAG